MKKRLFSIILLCAFCCQLIPSVGASDVATLTTSQYILTQQLESVVTETFYGGDTQAVTYTHTASDGLQYLLIYLTAQISEGQLDLNNLTLSLDGQTYGRILEDSFLETHSYNPLHHGTATIDSSGWVVFEVAESVTDADVSTGGRLSIDGNYETAITQLQSQIQHLITQTDYESVVQRQEALSASYLATAKAGNYTAKTPYIIINPYEIAPQSALVIFETDTPVSVTSIIHGKGEDLALALSTITNVNTEKTTWHEIPLIGLYEGENTVELQLSDGTSYTHTITTQEVPSKIVNSDATLIYQELDQLSPGLYQLKDYYRTLWDVNGDLRGYFTEMFNTSGIDHLDENGHIYGSTQSYTNYSTIYERDYLGYTYQEISTYNWSTHHDIYPLDNTLLTYDQAYDLTTGQVSTYVDWTTILNDTHGSFEVRDLGGVDWNHFNTITDGGDGYILLSFRNLHAVMKLSYPELEVQWVLSVNDQALAESQDTDLYLTPIGEDFEWFYSQHDVSLVSENDDGTIDITIYDNGAQRGLEGAIWDYPAEEMYTRMVRYRIDQTAMTVEQIWDWGQEYGTAGASAIHGSAQYISASNSYLGSFDTISNSSSSLNNYGPDQLNAPSKILEVSEAGDIIFGLELTAATYRTEKVETDTLYAAFTGIGDQTGTYTYASATPAQIYDETEEIIYDGAVYQITAISATQDYLNIAGWVAPIDDPSYYVSQRQVILRNTVTGQAYCYDLTFSTSQTLRNDVPAQYQDQLNLYAGFLQSHIDTRDVVDGTYSIELVATQNDVHYGVVTDYFLRIGDSTIESTLVTSTDLLASQEAISAVLSRTIEEGNYTFDDPLVVLDPYNAAPLSALIAFETDTTGTLSVEIAGKDAYTTVTHTFHQDTTTHTAPIYGLYADTNNQVTMTFTADDGTVEETVVYIQTDPLPDNFIQAEVTVADTALMADGFTFGVQTTSSIYAFDANGDIRWYITTGSATMPIKRLANGNLISGSNTFVDGETVAASLFEFDMLGHVHNEYLIYGAHHEIVELPNGDLLVAASRGDTVEDYVVRLDRTTGEIVQDWDFHDILDMDYYSDEIWQYHIYNNQAIVNPNKTEDDWWTTAMKRSANDWFHNNALYYVEEDNAIMASGRMKDSIVKFDADTGEVIWILTDPNTEWGQTTYADKILTPIGDDFEYSYGQHAITMAENGDILLFDNGNYRSKDPEDVLSATDSYSRAVRYAVDEENMTVEQIWQYGKELGNDYYSSYISDIDYLGTDHYFINFGGILIDLETGISYNSTALLQDPDAIDPQAITRMTEIVDDVVVFEVLLTAPDGDANTYRAERMTPYYDGEGYVDLTMVGQRLGSLDPTPTYDGLTTPEATNDILYTIMAIEDSGEDVYFNINVTNFQDYTQYIVLDNGTEQLVYDSNSVVKYGLEDGRYEIGLLVEEADGTLHYSQIYQYFIVNLQSEQSLDAQDIQNDAAPAVATLSTTLKDALAFQGFWILALAFFLVVTKHVPKKQ